MPKVDYSLFDQLAPRYMRDLMKDFGLTDFQAAGVAGNGGAESGGFKEVQELRPTVRGSAGGLGHFQWTGRTANNPRRKNFEDWLKRNAAKGWTPHTYEANYSMLFRELKGPEKAALEALKRTTNLRDATITFCRKFERAGIEHMEKRIRWAERALRKFHEQGGLQQESVMRRIPVPIADVAGGLAGMFLPGPAGRLASGVIDALKDTGADPRVPGLSRMQAEEVAPAVVERVLTDPQVQDALAQPKPWYLSTTVWGIAISVVFKLLAVVLPGKVPPEWEGILSGWLPTIISFAGDGLALFGRAKATGPLSAGAPAKPDTNALMLARLEAMQAELSELRAERREGDDR